MRRFMLTTACLFLAATAGFAQPYNDPARRLEMLSRPAIAPVKGAYEANRPKECWAVREELTRVRALIVVDTNSNVRVCEEQNLRNLYAALTAGIPRNRLEITVLSGEHATPQNVLRYYQNLQTGPNEAVLFYYGGHGGVDATRRFNDGPTLGHCLTMTAGGLYRRDLIAAIKARNPGLAVILTDCCSSYFQSGNSTSDSESSNENGRIQAMGLSHACRCLFFQHRGIVDITASEPGSFAYGYEAIGGFFTFGLTRIVVAPEQCLLDGGRNFITWGTVAHEVNVQVIREITKINASIGQRAFRFVHVAP